MFLFIFCSSVTSVRELDNNGKRVQHPRRATHYIRCSRRPPPGPRGRSSRPAAPHTARRRCQTCTFPQRRPCRHWSRHDQTQHCTLIKENICPVHEKRESIIVRFVFLVGILLQSRYRIARDIPAVPVVPLWYRLQHPLVPHPVALPLLPHDAPRCPSSTSMASPQKISHCKIVASEKMCCHTSLRRYQDVCENQ